MGTKKALVRLPSPKLAEGIVTNIDRRPIDYHLASKQWEGYAEALEDAGWEVIEAPPTDESPDGVFIEDTVVMFRNVAVIARPGAETRRSEVDATEEAMRELGCSINRILAPGTLDGGDVLRVDDTIYVGSGGRSNADGLRQLRSILEPVGATVLAVRLPLKKVVHLRSAMSPLLDGTIVGYPPFLEDRDDFSSVLAVPELSGAQLIDLGGSRIMMATDCSKSEVMLADLGYQVHTVDISEFQKLEGSVPSLSVRLRELWEPGP